jgi:hypothetical protein
MTMSAATNQESPSRTSSLRAICQRSSIIFGFKRVDESSFISPHVCLYLTDLGGNRIVFIFTNNALHTYTIEGIHYHDAGLLGAAVEFSHITAPDTKVRNHNLQMPIRNDQSVTSNSVAESDYNICAANHANLRFNAYKDSQSESVVNIFDLQNDKGFTDVMSALAQGRLRITLQLLASDTHNHKLYINDSLPMIA